MSTFLFDEIIFGPVKSRRLGNSLGINLLPLNRKFCNFNCVYCECGNLNPDFKSQPLPSRKQIADSLEIKLKLFNEQGVEIDSITYAGNGEPTMHKDFADIMADTVNLRNRYMKDAVISVLSNATLIDRPQIVEALKMADKRILKLDSAIDATVTAVNRPRNNYSVKHTLDMLKIFDGDFTLQTMFLEGTVNNHYFNNLSDIELSAWINAVKQINPMEIMIYTIDRDTPEQNLVRATAAQLDNVKSLLNASGFFNVKISC